ncbi:hypothetical protein CS542_09255 [Pedobacter sp. IW39]|nr:hypothetical protein CS542_09255 [Pedobacter sp. IW39]
MLLKFMQCYNQVFIEDIIQDYTVRISYQCRFQNPIRYENLSGSLFCRHKYCLLFLMRDWQQRQQLEEMKKQELVTTLREGNQESTVTQNAFKSAD